MRRRYVLKNKARFFAFILVTIFLTACLLARNAVYGYNEETRYVTVTVKSGDTLWTIAESFYDKGDIRKHIYNIKKANNMKSCEIFPGNKLIIPLEQ